MVECSICGHRGAHAIVVTEVDGMRYCESCPRCRVELQRLAQEPADRPREHEDGPR
jgi:hypothetical protein